MARDPNSPERIRHRLVLTLILLSPVAVLVLLVVLIARSIGAGPVMEAPRVGPGAGDTGGANAVGEMLFEERTPPPSGVAAPDARTDATPDEDGTSATEGEGG